MNCKDRNLDLFFLGGLFFFLFQCFNTSDGDKRYVLKSVDTTIYLSPDSNGIRQTPGLPSNTSLVVLFRKIWKLGHLILDLF